ncbi:MAG: hypothetical protein IPG64_22585 [Haliea sp.]|nr:hypothetical protein [Haliea sp.]
MESIIAAYDAAHWDVESVRSMLSMSDALSELDRSLVTLHLANALEDFLDDGMSCCSASKLAKMSCPEMQHGMLTLSHSHAWPALSISLEQAMSDFNAGRASVDRAGFMGKSALILPPSAGSRMLPTGWGWLVRRLRRMKALVRRDPLPREL